MNLFCNVELDYYQYSVYVHEIKPSWPRFNLKF